MSQVLLHADISRKEHLTVTNLKPGDHITVRILTNGGIGMEDDGSFTHKPIFQGKLDQGETFIREPIDPAYHGQECLLKITAKGLRPWEEKITLTEEGIFKELKRHTLEKDFFSSMRFSI